MRVGYVRGSTAEQNEARHPKMMEEQNIDQKDFKAMMDFVRAGDQ